MVTSDNKNSLKIMENLVISPEISKRENEC